MIECRKKSAEKRASIVSRELNNKPLVEVIFELRWALQEMTGRHVDPYYPIMLGEFFAAVKDQYPHWEALVPPGMPLEIAPNVVHHRFRTALDQWPLVQLGPGIITINETEGYRWHDFNKNCLALLQVLLGLYEAAGQAFQPVYVSLRYIDADVLGNRSVTELLSKLKLKLEPDLKLFESGRVAGPETNHLALALSYPSVHPKGMFTARFNQGKKNDQPGLIWETQIQSSGDDTPIEQSEVERWLEEAHATTSDWFSRQIEGELLEVYQ